MQDVILKDLDLNTDVQRITRVNTHAPKAARFINSFIDSSFAEPNVVATSSELNVEVLSPAKLQNLVNLKRANDIRYINKFFEAVNKKLEVDGIFIGRFETKNQRKERIFKKFPMLLAYPFYVLDFIWKRVFPKVWGLKKIYFGLTRGHNRVITLAEVLGRLVSCGFKIKAHEEINKLTYFCVIKETEPEFDEEPTYGPLVKLEREGYQGRPIAVYKFRTMHPFAEYLQEYIYEQNDLESGGKFKNDFRKTSWGKFMRKFWLDELPMFWNVLKGDLKLFGVRPISRQYFKLYPNDFRQRRQQYKPGLIPPFYVDMPESFDEIVESERSYLNAFDRDPIKTDTRYFFKALYNILFKRARSN